MFLSSYFPYPYSAYLFIYVLLIFLFLFLFFIYVFLIFLLLFFLLPYFLFSCPPISIPTSHKFKVNRSPWSQVFIIPFQRIPSTPTLRTFSQPFQCSFTRVALDRPGTPAVDSNARKRGDPEGRRLQFRHHLGGNRGPRWAVRNSQIVRHPPRGTSLRSLIHSLVQFTNLASHEDREPRRGVRVAAI